MGLSDNSLFLKFKKLGTKIVVMDYHSRLIDAIEQDAAFVLTHGNDL